MATWFGWPVIPVRSKVTIYAFQNMRGSRRGKGEETYERCRVSCEVGGEDGGDQPRVPKGGHRILQLASPRARPPQPGRTSWGMTGHSRMIDDVDALRGHAKERVAREELAASYAAEAGLVS